MFFFFPGSLVILVPSNHAKKIVNNSSTIQVVTNCTEGNAICLCARRSVWWVWFPFLPPTLLSTPISVKSTPDFLINPQFSKSTPTFFINPHLSKSTHNFCMAHYIIIAFRIHCLCYQPPFLRNQLPTFLSTPNFQNHVFSPYIITASWVPIIVILLLYEHCNNCFLLRVNVSKKVGHPSIRSGI